MPAGVQRYGVGDYDQLVKLLEGNDLVAELKGPDLRALSSYLVGRRVERDEALFHEEEPGDCLYLPADGEVRIFKNDEASHERVVAVESRLRSVGEMALLDGEPRSATCVAMRPSQLLVLRREAFERLCEERPILALHLVRRLARLVSRRLRLTSGQLVEQLGN